MKNKCKYKDHNQICSINHEYCQDFFEEQQMCKMFSESNCPDHPEGHRFVPCDEWSATCTCGEQR